MASEDRFEPTVAEESVRAATGRGWDAWFALVDGSGTATAGHAAIARWLMDAHGVTGWWAQSITVSYERARGLRAVGERTDGFAVGASRTFAVPAERVFDAFEDATLRARWLPGVALHPRTATRPGAARYDWEGGPTRVIVGIVPKGPAKSTASVSHERLPDARAAAEQKAFWRDRLAALKRLLESS